MGAVVDKKLLVGVTLAKMAAQQRQHTVFRFDLCAQCTAVVRKPHKTAQFFQLAVHMADGAIQRIAGRVG